MSNRYTADEDKRLCDLYPVTSNKDLTVRFNRSSYSIIIRAKRLRLHKSEAYTRERRCVPKKNSANRAELFLQVQVLTMRDTGARIGEMVSLLKVRDSTVKSFLHNAVEIGKLFTAGKRPLLRYFSSADAAIASAQACVNERANKLEATIHRRRATQRANWANKSGERNQARLMNPPKPPKIAKPKKERIPKVKKLKAFTKPKPIVLRHAGSAVRVDKSAPKRGPGNLSGPLIFTANTKYTICPSPAQPRLSNTAFAEW